MIATKGGETKGPTREESRHMLDALAEAHQRNHANKGHEHKKGYRTAGAPAHGLSSRFAAFSPVGSMTPSPLPDSRGHEDRVRRLLLIVQQQVDHDFP